MTHINLTRRNSNTSTMVVEEEYYLTSQATFWYGSFGILLYLHQQHQNLIVCTKFGMVLLYLVLVLEAGWMMSLFLPPHRPQQQQ